MLVAGIFEMIYRLVLHFPLGAFRPELSRREYLGDKRSMILIRIRLMQLITGWFMIPIALGLLVQTAARAHSIFEISMVILILVFASLIAYGRGRNLSERHLEEPLEEIHLELAGINLEPKIYSESRLKQSSY